MLELNLKLEIHVCWVINTFLMTCDQKSNQADDVINLRLVL